MSVLVLSEECDPTTDAVVEALDERGADVFRADLAGSPLVFILTPIWSVQGGLARYGQEAAKSH
jgi:hypothetical protein